MPNQSEEMSSDDLIICQNTNESYDRTGKRASEIAKGGRKR